MGQRKVLASVNCNFFTWLICFYSSHKRPPGDLIESFGQGFHQIENAAAAAAAVGFRCELCNITTTCQDQLQAHYNGQKHKKKLNKYHQDLGLVSPHDNILTSVLLNDAEKGDCSVYRTPSGQYYCQICNISSNSEPQFRQHLQSKSHLRNANTNKNWLNRELFHILSSFCSPI